MARPHDFTLTVASTGHVLVLYSEPGIHRFCSDEDAGTAVHPALDSLLKSVAAAVDLPVGQVAYLMGRQAINGYTVAAGIRPATSGAIERTFTSERGTPRHEAISEAVAAAEAALAPLLDAAEPAWKTATLQ